MIHFLCLLLPISTQAQSCQPLSNLSSCYPILDYNQVYVPATTCETEIEEHLLVNLTAWDLVSSTACRSAIAYYTCATIYPPCNSTSGGTPIPLCETTCNQLISNSNICSDSDFMALGLANGSWLTLTCSNLPSSNCNPGPNPLVPSALYSPYRKTCRQYPSNGICAKFINYPIYYTADWEFQNGEATVNKIAQKLVAVTQACADATVKFLCGIWFAGCNDTALSDTLQVSLVSQPIFPEPICYSVCEEYLTACAGYLEIFASLGQITHCNMSFVPFLQFAISSAYCNNSKRTNIPVDFQNDSYPLFYFFPVISTNSASTASFQTPCNLMPDAGSIGRVGTCLPPLVNATDEPSFIGYVRSLSSTSAGVAPCELACPAIYVWDETQWENAEKIMYLTVPSFILTTYLLVTWIIFPIKRKQQYNLAFITCIWLVSFVLTFGYAAVASNRADLQSLRYISCTNRVEGHSMWGAPSYCVFQAYILYFFLLSGTCWWFIIIIDLFRKVVLEERYTVHVEKRNKYVYHGYCWGFPILSLVLFLSTGGQLGGSNANIFLVCWIYTQRSPTDPWYATDFDLVRDYLFWYGPIGCMGLIGFTLMMIVIFKIVKSTRAAARNAVAIQGVSLISLHARPLFFALAFFFVFFWFFVWRVQYSISYTDWTEGVKTWLQCKTVNNHRIPCAAFPPRIPSWAWYGFHFFLSMQGVILTFTWGSQLDNITLWKDFITSHSLFHSETKEKTHLQDKSKGSKNSQISNKGDQSTYPDPEASGSYGQIDRSPTRGDRPLEISKGGGGVEMSNLVPSPSSPTSAFDFSQVQAESAASSSSSSTIKVMGASSRGSDEPSPDGSMGGAVEVEVEGMSIRLPSLPLVPGDVRETQWNTNPLLDEAA